LRASGGVAIGVAVAGALSALLLAVTEFLTVASVDVAHGSCQVINDSDPSLADRCSLSGFERHGGAFVLLAVLVLFMAIGASAGRSRPAAVALVVIGALVLGITLGLDLPQTHQAGAIGRDFEGATGTAGPGFFTELLGGLLALGAGVARLLRPG
jgi:FtsH-binding integral membrane protein